MVYINEAELRGRTNLRGSLAEESLRRFSKSATGTFDIFLSHSSKDASVIYGLRHLLLAQGLSVYVDWVDDPELDRAAVSAATADRLKYRMEHCKSLIFATSRAATTSRWMPWGLGYFDGLRGAERVSILPIEGTLHAFQGQEYLSLYKVIERVLVDGAWRPSAVRPDQRAAENLVSFGRGEGRFYDFVRR